MNQSEKTDVLNKALLKVHYEIGPIIELDRENPAFYKKDTGKGHGYASIGAVLKKIKPIANEHGLIIEQYPKFLVKSTASMPNHASGTAQKSYKDTLAKEQEDSGYSWTTDFVRKEEFSKDAPLLLATRITHGDSGQWKEIDYPVRVKDENDPQKLKSGHTYARRDSLELLFNVAESDDDDDGNLASEAKIDNRQKNAGKPRGTKNSDGSIKKRYQISKPWEPDPKAIEIKNRLHGASSNEELEGIIDDLKMIKEEAKVSEWDELSEEAQKYLGEVWEAVN